MLRAWVLTVVRLVPVAHAGGDVGLGECGEAVVTPRTEGKRFLIETPFPEFSADPSSTTPSACVARAFLPLPSSCVLTRWLGLCALLLLWRRCCCGWRRRACTARDNLHLVAFLIQL